MLKSRINNDYYIFSYKLIKCIKLIKIYIFFIYIFLIKKINYLCHINYSK